MEDGKKQKLTKLFDNFTRSKQIHEAVLFVENTVGNFSFAKTYGNRKIGSPLLMASITKMFTSTCVIKLLEQRKLLLADKISKYLDPSLLKGLHVYKNKDYSSQLTISDLLFQTSGLPDIYEEGKDCLKKRLIKEDFSYSFDEEVDLSKKLKSHFIPHSQSKAYYADINYDLLGKIIEKITDSTLAEVYQRFIFSPLKLKYTYLAEIGQKNLPYLYYKNQILKRPMMISSSRASGGGITTALELMEFLKAFFGGKLFNREVFPHLSVYSKMQSSMGPIRYGGGFMQIPLTGLLTLFMGKGEILGHCGSTGSFAFYYPYRDLFFVGDVNQMVNASLPIRLSMQIAMAMQ